MGYAGEEVGRNGLNLLVEDTIVVELKAIKNLEDIRFCARPLLPEGRGQNTGMTAERCQVNARCQASDCLLTLFLLSLFCSLWSRVYRIYSRAQRLPEIGT
jgi:hypothetical protein